MELWLQVLIEWINCLNVLQGQINDLKELEDGRFYKQLIELLLKKKAKNIIDEEDTVLKFLQDEYPEFQYNDKNSMEESEHMYIASLFLLHVSQEPLFQHSMCTKLQEETQIKIKSFLEAIIPYGRHVTKEKLKDVIIELSGSVIVSVTPRTRALKDFFNSPAARSAQSRKIMTERNRELRKLKSELETERFEKADLLDDLNIQQNKIQNLQKKLQDKSAELKALREERMSIKTPQSCKKNKNTLDCDLYYRKEIDRLEDQLMERQCEIDSLETDKDTLSKKLAGTERHCMLLKKKLESCEKSLENIQIEREVKDREVINLRMDNEELRTYLRELNRTSVGERSFEIDGIQPLNSPSYSLNTSEALSSVIDIQLQEAKEESASLKVQLDGLNKKLEAVTQEYNKTIQLNAQLEEQAAMLQSTQIELSNCMDKLSSLNKDNAALKDEKASLLKQNKSLQDLHISEKESKDALNTELSNLKDGFTRLEDSLHNETVSNSKLNQALAEAQTQITQNLQCIEDLTHQNNSYKESIECYNTNLKEVIRHNSEMIDIENNNLNGTTIVQLIDHLNKIVHNFEKKCAAKEEEVASLSDTLKQTVTKLECSQLQVSQLKQKEDQNNEKLNELTWQAHQYSKEVSNLKEIETQKVSLEKDLHKLQADIKDKNSLLKSTARCATNLKQHTKTLKEQLDAMKTEFLSQLSECKVQHMETVKKLSNEYKTLYDNYNKEQLRREALENKLAINDKELTNSQNMNVLLENNVLTKEQMLRDMEERLTDLKEALEQSTKEGEQYKTAKETLEKEHESMVTEKNVMLGSLKSENEVVLSDLKCMTNKYNLSQKEANNISNQLKLKEEQCENLALEIVAVKAEKEKLHQLQSEEKQTAISCIELLEARLLEKQRSSDNLSMELKLKEETLDVVKHKFEELKKETAASELKMKEVILNLQDVRASQDAVLVTQEKALKEKCSHLEQFQKEFNETKNALCTKLEEEKSLRHNLQSTYSDLQIQSYKQMKTIEELKEVLKKERNELNISKEYCKNEDTRKLEIIKLCKELEDSINDLKSTMAKTVSNTEKPDIIVMHNKLHTDSDDSIETVLDIIRSATNEVHASRKLISHLLDTNTSLNEVLQEQKVIVDNYVPKCEEIKLLRDKIHKLESTELKRVNHFTNLIRRRDSLIDSLQNLRKSRDDLDDSLNALQQRWSRIVTTFCSISRAEKCDKLKHIETMKTDLENSLSKHNIYRLQNTKPVDAVLWEKFLWTEGNLGNTYLQLTNNQLCLDVSQDIIDKNFSDEQAVIDTELEQNITLQKDIAGCQMQIEEFLNVVTAFEKNFNSDQLKSQSEIEKKLQAQIKELTEEKNDVQSKLDCLRIRNAKLEGQMDELRNKITELKAETVPLIELDHLKKEVVRLKEEKDELHKRPKKEDIENQMKDVHNNYEVKLDEIKQKMKAAYNEQVAKLNRDQEKCLQERLESLQKKMEQQCRKQAEEISKYKAHVAQMSSQIWNVGENLLTEQQENQKLRKELDELKAKLLSLNQGQAITSLEHKSSKYEKRNILSDDNKEEVMHKIAVIQEKTTYERRCSIRSIQTMGNAFNVEDEEGEVFDNTYLIADMKEGQSPFSIDPDRVSILQKRNALCKPHLKSSYPAEMQFHPLPFSEEDIKTGSAAEEIFNDSLSQSLLPEQKTKKKDRTQTSYKKPGPPTPSKNAGRLSLQSNELKSPNSRILRERNKDRSTTTPRTLRSLFGSKRQDEFHHGGAEEAASSGNIVTLPTDEERQ